MAKFLFCLPRFHTNAVPWVRLLREGGHGVAVHVSFIGGTESYTNMLPKVIRRSALEGLRIGKHLAPIERLPSLRMAWSEMAKEDPDVVIVRGVTRWLSRVAALCAILQGRRLVIYDQEDPSPTAVSTWLRRAIFRWLGVPHVTSRVAFLSKKPSMGDATSLPFGCPIPCGLARDTAIGNWPPKILMVAKYRERKGHMNLLRALSILAPTRDFSVTFCGEEVGNKDAEFCRLLRSAAAELGMADRLSFMNNVPYDRMHALYREHDLFVLPSLNEPAAVSPIEAAWCGCGVLVSRNSGTRGYLPPGCEYDFDPTAPEDIARAIANSIASPYVLKKYRQACKDRVATVAGDALILDRFEALCCRPATFG